MLQSKLSQIDSHLIVCAPEAPMFRLHEEFSLRPIKYTKSCDVVIGMKK